MDADDGFTEFVGIRGSALMRSAYLLTGDRQLAEDLLQTVLSRLFSRWRRIRSEEARESYVRTSLYREFVSWRRVRRNSEIPVDRPPETTGADDFTNASVRRLALDEVLGRLPRRQRAVIVLRFYEDRTVAETAALLGCSAGTVKRQTFDALSSLRALGPELAQLVSDAESAVDLGDAR